MSEQELNRANVCSIFQQVDGKGMSQRMGRDGLRNAANAVGFLTRILDGASRDGFAFNVSGKQPLAGLLRPPPDAQNVQQLWR
jgi:hypothetical protein